MRKSNRIFQGVGTVAIALSLVACGDSGSEDYGASALSETPDTSSLTDTGSTTSGSSSEESLISADSDTIDAVSAASAVTAQVNFTVNTSDTFYVEVTNTTFSGLSSAVAEVTGSQAAVLDLSYMTNTDLAAGSYSDSVEVKFCEDAACDTELAGSPYTILSSLTVDAVAVTDTDTATNDSSLLLKNEDRTSYLTDLFAATYVKQAGVFVAAVNSTPDELDYPPMTVIFVDPVTKLEGLVGYLTYPAVSISSDNTGATPRVVIGHDNGYATVIDYNKATPAASLNYLLNTGDSLSEVVLNESDIFAIPVAGGADVMTRVDIDHHVYSEFVGPEVTAGSSLSAHADGNSVYVAQPGDTGVIQHFDVSGSGIALQGDSSATGVTDLCGGIWSSADNDTLVSGCGDVFSSSSDAAADLLLLGNMSQPAANPLKDDQEVFWFADSEANTEEMLTLSSSASCVALGVDCPRTLSFYDKSDYSHRMSRTFGSFLAANDEPIRLELPVAAAYSEDGSQVYVLTRLDENLPTTDYDVDMMYLHVIERD